MRVESEALRRLAPGRAIHILSGEALGTRWQVRHAAAAAVDLVRLRAAIEARLAAIVFEMSQWEPRSRLSAFNRAAAGTWFSLPADFTTVTAAALDVAQRCAGAFDPTQGLAASLLGFGAETRDRPPSDAELAAARAAAGWQRLAFDASGGRLRQPGGLWLDFSGIAKGFAVDAVADLLRDAGILDALVEIGGELCGRGLRPDGQPWWVDVEVPPGITFAPMRIALHELAVATSGDYVRGAHTIDPRSGVAAGNGVVSVTVLHERAMLADAWATALAVLGVRDGMAFAERETLAARIVAHDRDGAVIEAISPALMAMLTG